MRKQKAALIAAIAVWLIVGVALILRDVAAVRASPDRLGTDRAEYLGNPYAAVWLLGMTTIVVWSLWLMGRAPTRAAQVPSDASKRRSLFLKPRPM